MTKSASLRCLLFCCFTLFALDASAAIKPEQVAIPTGLVSSAPQPLVGFVFRPEGKGPHPAVVMMHGCGGAYTNSGKLNARHLMWGEYLAEHGYLALMLDSFKARGIDELCTTKFADRTLREADRVGDAYAAFAYLRDLDGVDPRRIAVLGWSHGAGVTLDTITHKPKTGEGFAAAVAFYPGCTSRAKRADRFTPYAPLFILIGDADDWTPAAPCKTLTTAVAARGLPMQIITYPDTYHDFDNPGLKSKRVRKEVPNGVNPGAGVTTAPNPEAREDAKQHVLAWFAEKLK